MKTLPLLESALRNREVSVAFVDSLQQLLTSLLRSEAAGFQPDFRHLGKALSGCAVKVSVVYRLSSDIFNFYLKLLNTQLYLVSQKHFIPRASCHMEEGKGGKGRERETENSVFSENIAVSSS